MSTKPQRRPHLLIVERRLIRNRGHHHTQVAALETLLPDHEVVLLAGAGYDGFLPQPSLTMPKTAARDEWLARRLGFGATRQHWAARLELALRGVVLNTPRSSYGPTLAKAVHHFGLGPGDTVVVPTATLEDMGALADAITRLERAGTPIPAFHMRFLSPSLGEPDADLRHRRLTALLAQLAGRVALYGETEELAAHLSAGYDAPVAGRFYLPCSFDPTAPPPRHRIPGRCRVGVLGLPSAEKGADRIADIIAAARRAAVPATIVVQGRPADFAATGVYAAVQAEHRDRVRVEHCPDGLSPDAFRAVFADLDAVLLPYDPSVYGLQGSGMIQDAVAAEVAIVHSAGLSMRHLLSHGNALTATTDDDFAAALSRLSTDADTISAGCARARAAYRAAFDVHPFAIAVRTANGA